MTVSQQRYANTIETARVAHKEKSGDWMMRQFVAAHTVLVDGGVGAMLTSDPARHSMRLELISKNGESIVVADGAMKSNNTGTIVPRGHKSNTVQVVCESDVLEIMCSTLLDMGEYLS